MNILAAIILFIFALRLVSFLFVRFLAYKVRKAARKTMGYEHAETTDTPPKSRKKIFQKNDGDYVDFEEMGH